jgi:predicted nuclease of predicted toxin-antitoxin system
VGKSLIILTFDRDYGELLFKYQMDPPPAVVYFRTKGNTPSEAGNILLTLIESEGLEIEGYFTVVEENGYRQRKLG